MLLLGKYHMRKSVFKFAVIAGALLAGTSSASAALITYTATGNGTALLGNSVVTGPFSWVASGQNGPDVNTTPNVTAFLMDSLTVTFGGTTVSATNPIVFFTNTTGPIAGFVQIRPGNVIQGVLYFDDPIFSTYDPATAIGPIPVAYRGFQTSLDTTGGAFIWQGNPTNMTFTASLAAAPAVPEPATWGLMIVGFGIAGTALRRKPKVAVSFS